MAGAPKDLISKSFGHGFDEDVEVAKYVVHAEIAQLIREARSQAGLSQSKLAEVMGTTQPVISRLEDPDYDGHSISSLVRVATALGLRLEPPKFVAHKKPSSRLPEMKIFGSPRPALTHSQVPVVSVSKLFRTEQSVAGGGAMTDKAENKWHAEEPQDSVPDVEFPDAA